MPYHFFSVPALQPASAEEALNAFCAGHRVVAVQRQWIDAGIDSAWAFCVTTADGPGELPRAVRARSSRGAARVDYKEVLGAEEFKVFARLREWRKQRAEADGVPVYTVFTNEQLAEIARRGVRSADELGQVEGVGAARKARYSDELLGVLSRSHEPAPPAEDRGA